MLKKPGFPKDQPKGLQLFLDQITERIVDEFEPDEVLPAKHYNHFVFPVTGGSETLFYYIALTKTAEGINGLITIEGIMNHQLSTYARKYTQWLYQPIELEATV